VKDRLFALLTESLDDEHEVRVWSGALSAAREAGAGVLCVAGGALEDANAARRARNFAFGLVGAENVEGVLALSGAIASALGAEAYGAWLTRSSGLPTMSLGVAVEGTPSLTVDNRGGIRKTVLHAVREHGAQRVAFVRGPSASQEAEERLFAYRDALIESGIEPDARLEVEGDYTRASGAQAVRTLLDERRVQISTLDAVATANDYMALGFIDELHRRGFAVPEDLRVVGFDDVDSAQTAHPALTTARQPGAELGREGVHRLLALAKGEALLPLEVLPTELVVRASCGCAAHSLGLPRTNSILPPSGVETSFVQRRQIILAEMMRAARGSFGAAGNGWEGRLLDALVTDVRRDEPGMLQRALEQTLRKIERSRADARIIQDVLSALRAQALPCVAKDAVAERRLEDAVHDARVSASAFTAQSEALRLRDANARIRRFEARARAVLFDDPKAIGDVAAEELTAFGIEALLLTELDEPNDVSKPGRVVFGFGPAGRRAGGEEIWPRALPFHPLFERSRRALVLLPVVLRDRPLGVVLLSVSSLEGPLFEELREFFGTVLGVVRLTRELEKRGG
jgi:DNA-binding LacI/PurR family transcriptional regulator